MPEQPPTRPPVAVTVIKLMWCCLLAAVIAAGLMFPVVGGIGLMSNRASDVVANGSAQLVEGDIPAVSTMTDARGNPITCTIRVDGKVSERRTTEGPYARLICQG